jgi:hypothetical protein
MIAYVDEFGRITDTPPVPATAPADSTEAAEPTEKD